MNRSWWLGILAALLAVGCKPPQGVANRRLLDACGKNDLKGVQDALSEGADPNAVDPDPDRGFSALEEGAESPEIVRVLLKAGANPNKPDGQGLLPLGLAAAAGPLDSVQEILKAGAKLDATGPNGDTALAMAAGQGKVENAMFLVACGADVNARDKLGWTPIFHAAGRHVGGLGAKQKDRIDLTRFLIRSGADITLKDHKGRTALDYAKTRLMKALNSNPEVIKLLTPPATSATAVRRR